jgi:hypothetical protein
MGHDLFFLRDLLFSVVRILENPSWKAYRASTDEDERLVTDPVVQHAVFKFSTLLQEKIGELDAEMKEPPKGWKGGKWLKSLSQVDDDWKPKFEELKKDWTSKFETCLVDVIQSVENLLTEECKGLGPDFAKAVRQLVYRPFFAHGFFEVASFAITFGVSLGDNAVTRTVKLSPDSTDMSEGEPTALFRSARQTIREDGSCAISDVFLRSNDIFFFGGFFKPEFRAFDIVWGRLDGCEQLCQVLYEVVENEIQREKREARLATGTDRLPFTRQMIPRNAGKHCLPVFCFKAEEAVLSEELSGMSDGVVKDPSENRSFFGAMLKAVQAQINHLTGLPPMPRNANEELLDAYRKLRQSITGIDKVVSSGVFDGPNSA